MDNSKQARLLLLEHAAYIPLGRRDKEDSSKIPVRIMAMLVPKDSRVRWFYSALLYTSLLLKLEQLCGITPLTTIEPRDYLESRNAGKDHHKRLFVWMRESFLEALRPPHSPDYLHARSMTDWSPEITMSEADALKALATNSYLITNPPSHEKDLSDDRYLLELHVAERELASLAELNCAEYLFVKRDFFKDWYGEVMRTDKRIESGVRVRTDYAHQQWLERTHRFSQRRAKRLVAGWKELGLLEEKALIPWIREGGMLAHSVEKANRQEQSPTKGEEDMQNEESNRGEVRGKMDEDEQHAQVGQKSSPVQRPSRKSREQSSGTDDEAWMESSE